MLKQQNPLKAICMAVAALTAFSCSEDDLAGKSTLNGNTTIVASFEGANAGTRTSVNDANKVLWNKDDAFGLFYTSASQGTPKASRFSCPDADGSSTTATFSGTLDDGAATSYAVYPYDGQMSLDGATVTMNLPAAFNYTTASNGPMYATATDITQSISFRHLAGLLKLTISKGITADAKKFVITADKDIAGTYTADLSRENPVLAAKTEGTTNSKTITVTLPTFSDNGQGNSTTFYIPIPANTYATLSAKLLNGSDQELYVPKEWTNKIVERAGMLTASFGFVTIDAGTSATNDALKDAISNVVPSAPTTEITTEIQLSGQIDATTGVSAIEIPVNEKSNVSLVLDEVPTTSDEKPLVLKDDGASTAPTTAKNTVTVAIPQVMEAQTAPNFTITMPQTTVELAAADDKGTTYGKVIAKTAENTLVIKKGVTVKELVVEGGNVRTAGTITAISKAEGVTSTIYIYKEAGATLPENIPNGFEVIDATVYDMKNIAKNGGTYVLNADVILSEPLSVASTMTLDLNGHSITPRTSGLDKVGGTNDAVVLIHRGAKLTINDNSASRQGSIHTNNVASVYTAVKLTDGNDTGTEIAEVTVNGGIIKGSYYGIAGNGTRHGTKITVNGGSVEALRGTDEGVAIFHPQEGTLNVTGGIISGYRTGIEIRSGVLTVSGGTIKCTSVKFEEGPNGSGTTISGAAVAVSQHVTNKPLKVNVNGGTLQGLYALYEKDQQDTEVSGNSMEVTGGTLNGKVYSQNCSSFIKGGQFSDMDALAYLKDGANVNIALDKDCSIPNINVAQGTTVTIDLNQKTLTTTNSNVATDRISGSLKITNGNLKGGTAGIALFAENAKIELDGVTCTLPSTSFGIFNDQNVQSSTVIVKNSTINSGYYGISTNASTNPVGSTAITLENSTFTAVETALMVNIPATVTAKECTFTGGWQGVLLRGATTTFTNCNINFKYDSSYGASSVVSGASTWENGNQAPSAALTMGNRSSKAYDYKTTVNLTNTKFSNNGSDGYTNYPAIYIDAEMKAVNPNQGVIFTYDEASKTSFNAAGTGLVINQKDNVTLNGTTPE